MLEWQTHPHSRLNLLTGEWVLVSPQRTERPWQGEVERPENESTAAWDPACYLCPGNQRAGGQCNPSYTETFAFDNDFPALRPDTPLDRMNESGLRIAEAEPGIARVLCFSPVHDLTLARMQQTAIVRVVDAWRIQNQELGGLPPVNYVQIFENRGQMMGASNPHPHCQIWASHRIPNEIVKEQTSQQKWMAAHGTCLLCDYLALEKSSERVVCENAEFLALVPFWAVWPFETLILSRRHISGLAGLRPEECAALADILKQVTTRYDNLFESPCPYTMGFHQSPCDGNPHEEWHLHAHFLPPVLRSARIRKFMVGYELLAMPQRDVTPEAAAERLRALPSVHYMDRANSG
jgi:UDPglucose--hexose-1-phosphate uridylyltransferase